MNKNSDKFSRKEIFGRAAKNLRADFNESYNIPHALLKGQEVEKILCNFLNNHLPRRFEAGSGFIIDFYDQVSQQTDIIIYDALNCPLYRASENSSITPNDNVAAVIEVKSVLNKKEIEDAANKIYKAKTLAKRKPPDLPFLVQYETMGFLFAFSSALKLDTVAKHFKQIFNSRPILGPHIDFIIILDVGIVCLNVKPTSATDWAPALIFNIGKTAGEGTHVAVASLYLGEQTLDSFFKIVLTHLQFFRGIIDNPGFCWEPPDKGPIGSMIYLTSITHEKDPQKRKKKLEEYKEQVIKEFRGEGKSNIIPRE